MHGLLTFASTRDRILIADLVRRAWDRPAMLSDGAALDHVPILDNALYVIATEEGCELALFIGVPQSAVCIDLHVCILPECRGHRAIEVSRAFLSWLATATPYRKAIGSIPAYNKPMIFVALRAGMRIYGRNRESTMRNGILYDQVLVERRLK